LIGKALLLGSALIIGVVVILIALRDPIEGRLLRGSDDLFIALIAVLIGWAGMSITRGVLSGAGRFGRYAIVVGMDGFLRVAFAIVLAVIGYETLGWYGVIFAAAPYVAILFGLFGARDLAKPGPEARFRELSTAIGWLLLGSTFAQALGYSAYVGASLLAGPSQNAELGAFVAAIFIARVPILLFQAVQAALLPRLAGLLSSGHVAEFRSGFIRLLALVVGFSIVGVLLAATVGPFIGAQLFGANFSSDGKTLGMLTAGCCLVVIGLTLGQALIALRRYVVAALAWVLGFAAFLAVLVPTSGDVFTRSEIAFVVGGLVAVAVLGFVTWRSVLRVGCTPVSSGTAMRRPA
jgi:O-antigen/teichoic acid export membrane protein